MLNRKMAAQVSRRFGLDAEQNFSMGHNNSSLEIQLPVTQKYFSSNLLKISELEKI